MLGTEFSWYFAGGLVFFLEAQLLALEESVSWSTGPLDSQDWMKGLLCGQSGELNQLSVFQRENLRLR